MSRKRTHCFLSISSTFPSHGYTKKVHLNGTPEQHHDNHPVTVVHSSIRTSTTGAMTSPGPRARRRNRRYGESDEQETTRAAHWEPNYGDPGFGGDPIDTYPPYYRDVVASQEPSSTTAAHLTWPPIYLATPGPSASLGAEAEAVESQGAPQPRSEAKFGDDVGSQHDETRNEQLSDADRLANLERQLRNIPDRLRRTRIAVFGRTNELFQRVEQSEDANDEDQQRIAGLETTLQEQQGHINGIETALEAEQGRVRRLEDSLGREQQFSDRISRALTDEERLSRDTRSTLWAEQDRIRSLEVALDRVCAQLGLHP